MLPLRGRQLHRRRGICTHPTVHTRRHRPPPPPPVRARARAEALQYLFAALFLASVYPRLPTTPPVPAVSDRLAALFTFLTVSCGVVGRVVGVVSQPAALHLQLQLTPLSAPPSSSQPLALRSPRPSLHGPQAVLVTAPSRACIQWDRERLLLRWGTARPAGGQQLRRERERATPAFPPSACSRVGHAQGRGHCASSPQQGGACPGERASRLFPPFSSQQQGRATPLPVGVSWRVVATAWAPSWPARWSSCCPWRRRRWGRGGCAGGWVGGWVGDFMTLSICASRYFVHFMLPNP